MKEYIVEFGDALYNEETGEAVFKPKIEVELIRCKDCKHCVEGLTFGVRWLRCEQNRDAMKEVNDSDWCCWAERKEDG